MKNKIVIIAFFLAIIFGFIAPFWDSFVVIEVFFGFIPLLLLLLVSLVLIVINSLSKDKKISDSIISTKIKEETYDFAKHGTHLPNKMHLDACQQGSRVYRNRKKYTRK